MEQVTILAWFGPLAVGCVLLLAGILKALDATSFTTHLSRLVRFPPKLNLVAAPALIGAECALGTGLIVGMSLHTLIPATILLLLGFSALSQWGIASERVKDCGCYGGLLTLTPKESAALNGLYVLLLAAAWLAGARDKTYLAAWQGGVALAVGTATMVFARAVIRYEHAHGHLFFDLSPLRPGRAWQPGWLGMAAGGTLSEGSRLVVLLSMDCPRCQQWMRVLPVVHARSDLPEVLVVLALAPREVDAFRKSIDLAIPLVFLKPRSMHRLTRLFPVGILVEDGIIREIWRGFMPEHFVERLRGKTA